ncbi:MAG: hypothetical protein U5R49_05825 [Deltaproteobacteria bacterium]|nr:hypothetical protein [Deltaproteobacteria bacterium]
MEDIYMRLARHLETLIMGYPFSDDLIRLLKETYTPEEAQVALAIPNTLAPLEVADIGTISARSKLPRDQVETALNTLSSRNMLYMAPTAQGETGYALLQVGYGIPQTFFWGGQQDQRAEQMARLVLKYFSASHHPKGLRRHSHQNVQIQPRESHRGCPYAGRAPQ